MTTSSTHPIGAFNDQETVFFSVPMVALLIIIKFHGASNSQLIFAAIIHNVIKANQKYIELATNCVYSSSLSLSASMSKSDKS